MQPNLCVASTKAKGQCDINFNGFYSSFSKHRRDNHPRWIIAFLWTIPLQSVASSFVSFLQSVNDFELLFLGELIMTFIALFVMTFIAKGWFLDFCGEFTLDTNF